MDVRSLEEPPTRCHYVSEFMLTGNWHQQHRLTHSREHPCHSELQRPALVEVRRSAPAGNTRSAPYPLAQRASPPARRRDHPQSGAQMGGAEGAAGSTPVT